MSRLLWVLNWTTTTARVTGSLTYTHGLHREEFGQWLRQERGCNHLTVSQTVAAFRDQLQAEHPADCPVRCHRRGDGGDGGGGGGGTGDGGAGLHIMTPLDIVRFLFAAHAQREARVVRVCVCWFVCIVYAATSRRSVIDPHTHPCTRTRTQRGDPTHGRPPNEPPSHRHARQFIEYKVAARQRLRREEEEEEEKGRGARPRGGGGGGGGGGAVTEVLAV